MTLINFFLILGNIATFLLLLFTICQYLKNNRDKLKREERNQAEKISTWIISKRNNEYAFGNISNQSKTPIYEVIITLVPFQGSGDLTGKNTPEIYREFFSVIPPGHYYIKIKNGWSGMSFHPNLSVAFIDAAGINWKREGDGYLHKINSKPPEYYNISRPLSWEFPSEMSDIEISN